MASNPIAILNLQNHIHGLPAAPFQPALAEQHPGFASTTRGSAAAKPGHLGVALGRSKVSSTSGFEGFPELCSFDPFCWLCQGTSGSWLRIYILYCIYIYTWIEREREILEIKAFDNAQVIAPETSGSGTLL